MTVIKPNSIAGITSITALGNSIEFYDVNGGFININNANVNTTAGVSTFNDLNVTGNVSIGGTLTYEDVTNVDSIGLITARNGVQVTGGNLLVGTSSSTGTTSQTLQITGGSYISGSTGIGTTNPQYTLDVLGDINLTGTFRQNGSQFVASRWTSGTGDDIYRLDGDVGIGTTNPTSKLTVTGDGNFTGVVTATTFSGQVNAGVGTVTTLSSTNATLTNINSSGVTTTTTLINTGLVGVNTTTVVGSASSQGAIQAVGNISITDGVYMMDSNIDINVTVPSGKNALMIGPITVGTGYTVLVESGSTLVVV